MFSYELDSVEECLIDAREEDEDAKVVFIGESVEIEPKICAYTLLEALELDILDDYPYVEECALFDYSKEDETQELENKLNQVLKEWMTKYNYSVGRDKIINAKKYNLQGEKKWNTMKILNYW